ncbi:MAG: sigma-70 family RNA polymerase sigma factor [Actinomycetota bacterium]
MYSQFRSHHNHDVFLGLLDRPEAWDPDRSPLGAYVVMLARRRAVDAVRRAEAVRRRERTVGCDRSAVAIAPLERTGLHGTVRQLVGQLPADQRDVVERAYFGERSYRQAAIDLGIPEGTAKTRLRTALASLREHPALRAHV